MRQFVDFIKYRHQSPSSRNSLFFLSHLPDGSRQREKVILGCPKQQTSSHIVSRGPPFICCLLLFGSDECGNGEDSEGIRNKATKGGDPKWLQFVHFFCFYKNGFMKCENSLFLAIKLKLIFRVFLSLSLLNWWALCMFCYYYCGCYCIGTRDNHLTDTRVM